VSNVAGKAYGMIVITPLAKRLGWTNKWVFRFGRSFPGILAGLIGLKFIHFARWVIITKDAWPTLCDGTTPVEFAEAYRKKLKGIQNDLTTQGFSPVASISTDMAEENRQQFNALQNKFNEAWRKEYGSGEGDNA
jgi:hypothetical protein